MTPLELTADFPCANARDIRRIDDVTFTLHTQADDACDHEGYGWSDYYAAFRLHNPNDVAVDATVQIYESQLIPEGRSLCERDVLDGDQPDIDSWRAIPRSRVTVKVNDDEGYSEATLTVQPGASLDVATMAWISPAEVDAAIADIKARCGDRVRVGSFGTTPQGRDMPFVDFSAMAPADAPLMVVAATPQCHELGTYASVWTMQAAASGALQHLTSKVRLIVAPLTNPDGNAAGSCMINSRAQNLVFGFGRIGEPDAAPECDAMWAFMAELNPDCYLEFHSYPHLQKPSFRAYEFDAALYPDDTSRARGLAFAKAIDDVTPNPPVPVVAGGQMATQFKPSLIARLVMEQGMPATLYKLHNRESQADNRKQAQRVVASIATWLAGEVK